MNRTAWMSSPRPRSPTRPTSRRRSPSVASGLSDGPRPRAPRRGACLGGEVDPMADRRDLLDLTAVRAGAHLADELRAAPGAVGSPQLPAPLGDVAVKKVLPRAAVSCWGVDERPPPLLRWPGAMSLTSRVPARVPSLRHSSEPVRLSKAAKRKFPPGPGAPSPPIVKNGSRSTAVVPSAVPSVLQRTLLSAVVAMKKARSPATVIPPTRWSDGIAASRNVPACSRRCARAR